MRLKKSLFLILACIVLSMMSSMTSAASFPNVPTRLRGFKQEIRGAQRFAFELFNRETREISNETNMVFSPFSIYSSLTMVGRGAGFRSNSFRQIKKALGLNHSFRVFQQYRSLTFEPSEDYKMSLAQRCYVDKSIKIADKYTVFLNTSELAHVYKVDFQNDKESARKRMNRWVKQETFGEITDLVSEDQVTSLTRIYLINAIALEAPWHMEFQSTGPGYFKTSSAGERMVTNMMRSYEQRCKTRTTDRYTTLLLPLKGGKLHFMAIMPREIGDFSIFNGTRGAHLLRSELRAQRTTLDRKCMVTMPEFAIKHRIEGIREILTDMGVRDIFDPDRADLSRMLKRGDDRLYVSSAAHVATFEVDEKGIKATGATAFGSGYRSMPLRVTIDQPFFFTVVHAQNDAVLFMGRLVKPKLVMLSQFPAKKQIITKKAKKAKAARKAAKNKKEAAKEKKIKTQNTTHESTTVQPSV